MNSVSVPTNPVSLIDAEELITALNQEGNRISLYKSVLKTQGELLASRFETIEDGLAVNELVLGRATLIDTVLQTAWQTYFEDQSDIALIAVGGYGRGELHPASDIDLLLLLTEDAREPLRESIESFLTFLWDIGLEVGQSVRTIRECVEEGAADISVATNLLEARLLAGSQTFFNELRYETGPDRLWHRKEFFAAKRQEQVDRHKRFGDTAYRLEPHIKEGPGGLRDIQTVYWVAKHHFGTGEISALVDCGFLTDDEFDALVRGQAFLWRIRSALHLMTNRREDRLLFEYQRDIAKLFGYEDSEARQAVELFMQDYYRTVMELERLNEMLLQFFDQAIFTNPDVPPEIVSLNKRFNIRDGYIQAASETTFTLYPFALLEIFLLMQQNPDLKGIAAETIRQIRASLYLIDNQYRQDIRNTSLFLEIMRQPEGITHELRRMNRYGVLAAYLPVFGRVVGLMQHDLFHIYTVDEHTLMVVRNLRRFTVPEFAHEFETCSAVSGRIPKPELLYLAGFFHDIAKGRGGHHEILGAEEAEEFALQHKLNNYDRNLVSWIVKSHLIMSATAQKKDISDPDVINEFANIVGDQAHLDYLYLLTVADICGTDPGLWNSWKDTLLRNLYLNTTRALRRGLENPIDLSSRVNERKLSAQDLLKAQNVSEENILKGWANLPDDYFVSHDPGQIAWHFQVFNPEDSVARPAVLARTIEDSDNAELFIYCRNRDGIFAITSNVLERIGLNILQTRLLITTDDYSVGSYRLSGVDAQDLQALIADNLVPLLVSDNVELKSREHQPSRALKHFTVPTRVTFLPKLDHGRNAVEIISTERPGLLAKVGKVFYDMKIRLVTVNVATFGSRAEDMFFVTDLDDNPLSEEQKDKLEAALISELDSPQN